jgi:hypothetical protein
VFCDVIVEFVIEFVVENAVELLLGLTPDPVVLTPSYCPQKFTLRVVDAILYKAVASMFWHGWGPFGEKAMRLPGGVGTSPNVDVL